MTTYKLGVGMGSTHANYLKLIQKKRKTPLFRTYIELFRGKKSIIHIYTPEGYKLRFFNGSEHQ